MMDTEEGPYELMSIRDQLVSLQAQNLDLPAIPSDVALIDHWFTQVKRRISLRATRRSEEEKLALLKLVNELELQHLTFLQTTHKKREISELADLELDAKKEALRVQIAESQDKIDQIKEGATRRRTPAPAASSPPQPKRLDKIERIAQVKERAKRNREKYSNDPEIGSRVANGRKTGLMIPMSAAISGID